MIILYLIKFISTQFIDIYHFNHTYVLLLSSLSFKRAAYASKIFTLWGVVCASIWRMFEAPAGFTARLEIVLSYTAHSASAASAAHYGFYLKPCAREHTVSTVGQTDRCGEIHLPANFSFELQRHLFIRITPSLCLTT